jgi:hypothetical protein
MVYCEGCRTKYKWPIHSHTTNQTCEICLVESPLVCFDMPSLELLKEVTEAQVARKFPIAAELFCTLLDLNLDNKGFSDADFREFVRNTLPIVAYEPPGVARAKEEAKHRMGQS